MSEFTSRTDSPPIRLYSYVMSPYAAKVHCFLLYKQLDFECSYVNPMRAHKELPVGRQVPVLTVGDESLADSTPIGLWLDELFPTHPLLLPEEPGERAQLMAVDDWISNALIPGSFRSYPGTGVDRFLNGWKLSSVMGKTADGGLPLPLRIAWPLFVTNVPFVKRAVAKADDGRPVRESKLALYDAFIAHLDGGPFVGGRATPSLPDLAAYPQFALYYITGFRGSEDILGAPALMEWLTRMEQYVTGTPDLIPEVAREKGFPSLAGSPATQPEERT